MCNRPVPCILCANTPIMRTSSFLLLLGALALAGTLSAQGLGEVRGRVFDTEGNSLPMASVYSKVNGELFGTTTDLDGRFVLKPLAPGNYAITISYSGRQPCEYASVSVVADRASYLPDTKLRGMELPPIVIRGTIRPLIEKDDPSRMTLLADEIAKDPNIRNPVQFLGKTFAGVTPAPNGEGLYFRGSRTENMATFLDGVKIAGAVPNIPPSAISSVSVYTGGLPARYGDVTGGVVVIETKSYAEMVQHARRMAAMRTEEEGDTFD
jgi:hypothetical protein